MSAAAITPQQELELLQEKLSVLGVSASFTDREIDILIDAGSLPPRPEFDLTEEQLAEIEAQVVEKRGPQWLAPFHMPQFNNEEYLEQKAKYVAEHGYAITVPALSDIFHFGKTKPMTKQEKWAWENEKWDMFSEDRINELEVDMRHKRDRMIAMLGSPTPELFSKLGAILTAVDDAQDAISTIAAVGRITRKIAPKVLSRLLGGPIGLLLTINDIMNLVTSIGSIATFGNLAKRQKDQLTGSNPFSKKAKIKRWKKLRSWKPTFADVIQAAQTTDQIFGVGVSLGPITGFIQDVYHGFIRQSTGVPVKWQLSPHFIPEWLKTAYNAVSSSSAYLAVDWNSPDHEILSVMQGYAMAQEAVFTFHQRWNPLDQVENIENSEIHCPIPTHPTTLWAMKELDIKVEDVIGWPVLNKTWASPDELTEVYAPLVTKTLKRFVERHNHDSMGALATSLATDSAFYSMANIDGEENVEYDYTTASKVASSMLMSNIYPAPESEQDPEALRKFYDYLEYEDSQGRSPNIHQVKGWARYFGYKLLEL